MMALFAPGGFCGMNEPGVLQRPHPRKAGPGFFGLGMLLGLAFVC